MLDSRETLLSDAVSVMTGHCVSFQKQVDRMNGGMVYS